MRALLSYARFLLAAIAINVAAVVSSAGASSSPCSESEDDPLTRDDIIMIPKYKQSNHEQMVLGAKIAQAELNKRKSPPAPNIYGSCPSREQSRLDQISMVEHATELDVAAIMIANNAGKDIENYTFAAAEKGIPIVTYDSPLKGGRDVGESLFVSPVDFRETGMLLANMTKFTIETQHGNYSFSNGPKEGGDFVILSTTPNSANQNLWIQSMKEVMEEDDRFAQLNLVGDGVYYPTVDNADGYRQITLELVELKKNGTLPNLSLIVAPTTSGATAAANTLLDYRHCGAMQVVGLAQPAEMLEASVNGCAPAFALFLNLDIGYLAYHATHALISREITGAAGESFNAGKLGTREIQRDPVRGNNSLWVLLGDFIVYNTENVARAANVECTMGFCDGKVRDYLEERFMEKYKKKAIALVPKFTGMLSFISSTFLVQHILRSKKQRMSVYSRIIVGVSTADMLSSFFGFFLSTWPMPADTWLAYGASGTVQTCSMQGFFFQLGLCASTLYQCSLVCYYFLTVVKGFGKTRLKKWEPLFHVFPCTIALSTAVAGLALKLYNPMMRGSSCWIKEYPAYCGESLSCQRGGDAMKYRWGFLYGFVTATFIWLVCAMLMMFHNIRTTEKRVAKYRHRGNSNSTPANSQSREVAAQALLYSLAYTIPWIWGLILTFINTGEGVFKSQSIDDAVTALNIVNVIIFPLQGFLNVCIYVRPRFIEARKRDPNSRKRDMVWAALFPKVDRRASIPMETNRPSMLNRIPRPTWMGQFLVQERGDEDNNADVQYMNQAGTLKAVEEEKQEENRK